ncbi:MAG TPA: hypothetical protein GX534_02410 [Thermoanaerobacterales bacterium]|jgi:hypothetical protein|nr:hypothetical protein [Thermoanaerobacterales bacterium]
MYIDFVGIILTVLIISPVHWINVLVISFLELLFSIFISIVFQNNVTEVIAGGIFTSMTLSNKSFELQIISPILLLLLGLGRIGIKNVPWFDLLNPLSYFKNNPWSIMLIKISIFKILVLYFTR